MNKLLLTFLVAASLLAGCSKEISVEHGTGTNTGGTGGNTGGNGNNSTDTYQPFTANSFWKYHQSGTVTGDNTVTATGQKQTINGIVYYTFNNAGDFGSSQSYMGVKNHNYYTYAKGTSPNTGAPFDLTFLYLNDTASVGYTWQFDAGQGNGFAAKTPGSVKEKGISMTVSGKNYTDVIHTQSLLEYDIPGFGLLDFATYDYYVAKNIGIIRVVVTGDPTFGGGISSTTDLVDYSIK